MQIKIDPPERRGLLRELRAYIIILKIFAIAIILLTGIVTLARLDAIMSQQSIQEKTMADCMDQLMWIRMEVEELKDVDEPEIVDSGEVSLTPEERDLVERIVAAEARGEPIEGMAAVAQVIRDRATEWGLSVTEVVMAPGQFASPYRGEISQEVVQAVWAVFDEGMTAFDGPVTHFHSESISAPCWTDGKVCRGSVAGNRFYF